ncbi:hypothetical protein KQH49_08780 [Mycetohabitans sp. B5]|uniref:Uncharacterized protein n=1 Tax=Mycetohabitans endofungorum TaxID=417203 RepID=A0A2P5K765_9BURK|nr:MULTISPECIES: hypothetical protein [Mycetohabitans]MCG1055042.1 hypothetical protein [Mycetohabitans sp. B5]PPB81902.1 hypothetical protein B0O95_11818 [Mycetohabitans endofungorum]
MPHLSDHHTRHTSVVPQPSQPLETLAKHFSAGHIPSQQDFHDVIDMAAATYTLIDSGRGPGDGLELDDHNTLRVQAGEGVRVSENGVSLAVEPNGALQFNEARQLTLDRHKVLSVEAVKALPEADRAAIWQELKSATPPANGGVRASAASLAPLSRRTAIASTTARKLPQSEQALNVLQSHFASGHIPTEDDFHDLITLASASYLLAGSDYGVGAGLMLDETGRLAVHANPEAGIHAEEYGVRLALEQNGGLQWSTAQQLQLDVPRTVSRAAFESLSNDVRYATYQLLENAAFGERFNQEQSWAIQVGNGKYPYHGAVAAISANGCTIAYAMQKADETVVRVCRRAHAHARWPDATEDADIPVQRVADDKELNIAVSETGRMVALSSVRSKLCLVYGIDDNLKSTPMGEIEDAEALTVIDVSESYNELIAFSKNEENINEPAGTVDIIVHYFLYQSNDRTWLKGDSSLISIDSESDVKIKSSGSMILLSLFSFQFGKLFDIYDNHNWVKISSIAGGDYATLSSNGSKAIVGKHEKDGSTHVDIYVHDVREYRWTDTLVGPSLMQRDGEVKVCANDRGDIAIGLDTDDSQEVWVYYNSTAGWSQAHRLTADTPASRYGTQVEMSADVSTLVVMAADRVYVYSRGINEAER